MGDFFCDQVGVFAFEAVVFQQLIANKSFLTFHVFFDIFELAIRVFILVKELKYDLLLWLISFIHFLE